MRHQIEPVHPRHVLIDHQAAAAGGQLGLPEQLARPGIDPHHESFDLERELERVAHRYVIIDDDNQGACSQQFALSFHQLAPESPKPRALAQHKASNRQGAP
jgi:hypothetical protein